MSPRRSLGHSVLTRLRTEPGLELLTYVACLASPLVFFGRPLLRGRVLVAADMLQQFWPYRHLWATYIREGALPLWNPYVFSGMPFLGDPQFATLYPLNLLFLLFPSLMAIQLYTVLGYALLAAFTYYYLRTLGQSRTAGLCAALSMAYGLYAVIHFPHVTMVHCMLWLPLQLALTERLAATRQLRYAMFLGLALAMQVFSGYPQFLLYGALVLGGYQLIHVIMSARRHRGELLGLLGMALLTGITLSAVQLLPSLELAMLSSRQAMSYEEFSAYSLRPVMLVQLVVPFFFGAPSEFLYAIKPYVLDWHWEVVFYAGAVPVLCLMSLVTVRRWSGWRELFWWSVLAWGLLFALGHNTPIYRLVYHIPVYNWFRVAGRHLFLASLALAVIAGLRIEHLLHADRRTVVRTFAWFLVATAVLITLCMIRVGSPLERHLRPRGVHPELLLPLVTFALAFLVLWRCGDSSHRRRRLISILLMGLVAGDLILTSGTTVPSIPRSVAVDHLNEFQELARVLPNDGRRLWFLPPGQPGNSNLFARLPFATSYNPLIIHDYEQLAHFRGPTPTSSVLSLPETIRETVFNLLDVGYLLVPRESQERSLLDVACSHRIQGYCFADLDNRLELLPDGQLELHLPPGQALTGMSLISALAAAPDVPNQTPVATLTFLDGNSNLLATIPLLAGVHTAEWAADCLAPDHRIRHQQPPVGHAWDASRANGTACLGYAYISEFDLDLKSAPSRLTVRNTSSGSVFWLDGLSLRIGPEKTVGYALETGLYDAVVSLHDPDWITGRFAAYRRQSAWGHAWPVEGVRAMNSAAFLRALDSSDSVLDFARWAYVDEGDLTTYLQIWPDLLTANFDPHASVHITALNPNAHTLEVTTTAPAFVVVSEVYYPGWVALVDGEESELLRVDHALRGVMVPPGVHAIEFVYRPPLVYWGLVLGVLGLAFTGGLLWLSARQGRVLA